MAKGFMIGVEGRAAGIVVEERGGFRFFASGDVFRQADRRLYRRVGDAERSLRDLWRAQASGHKQGPIGA